MKFAIYIKPSGYSNSEHYNRGRKETKWIVDKNKSVVFWIHDIGWQQASECQAAHYVVFLYMWRRNYVLMMSDLKLHLTQIFAPVRNTLHFLALILTFL